MDAGVARPVAARVTVAAQLVLAVALLAAAWGWRDGDPMLRLAMPAIGFGGLAGGLLLRGRPAGRWILIAIDVWFVSVGIMLSMSVASELTKVSGQFDPGPDVIARLDRFSAWLDPAIQRWVASAFLFAGTIGAIAAARSRRGE
jgi:hypothetical protein